MSPADCAAQAVDAYWRGFSVAWQIMGLVVVVSFGITLVKKFLGDGR